MQILQTHSHLDRISQYPQKVILKLKTIREMIIQAAKEEQIALIEETLKWNEPSFVTKGGSTIRYDWKEKTPDQVQIYFKCTSKIVPSIKAKFGDDFSYETTRAISFGLNDKIPPTKTKTCIKLALKYHSLKHLEHLGLK